MAKIQYAAALSATTPYIRIMKFSDTEGANITPPFASPGALVAASFSPDGKALVAALAAAGTSPLRLWLRDSNLSDTFVEHSISNLPSSNTIRDILFINDSEFVIAADGQIWVCALNRSTGVVTFTSISTYNSYGGGARSLEKLFGGEMITVSNPNATTSASGAQVYYRNSGTWSQLTHNLASNVDSMTAVGYDILAAHVSLGAMFRPNRYTWGTPPSWATSTVVAINGGLDNVTYDGSATGTPIARNAVSPDNAMVLVPKYTTPFVALRLIFDFRNPAYFADATGPTFPVPPAKLIASAALAVGIFLVSVDSTTITTGRVRGWRYTGPKANLTEVDGVSELFVDWDAKITYLTVAPVVEIFPQNGTIYYAAIPEILERSISLTDLKIALLGEAATFDPTHDTLAEVLGANEAYGSSWPQGGIDTSTASFVDGALGQTHLVVPIPDFPLFAGGSLIFRKAVIYDDSHVDKLPIGFLEFPATYTLVAGDSLEFSSPSSRLITIGPGALT